MRTYYSSQTLAYVSLNLTCNLAVGFFYPSNMHDKPGNLQSEHDKEGNLMSERLAWESI